MAAKVSHELECDVCKHAAYIWCLEREVGRQLDLEAKCSTLVWAVGLGAYCWSKERVVDEKC